MFQLNPLIQKLESNKNELIKTPCLNDVKKYNSIRSSALNNFPELKGIFPTKISEKTYKNKNQVGNISILVKLNMIKNLISARF